MAKVRYIGTSDIRTISKSEFSGASQDHEAVRWDSSNGFVADVNDKVAKWLSEEHSSEFKLESATAPEKSSSAAQTLSKE